MKEMSDHFEKHYTKEEMIFCEFEKGDTFYFIKSGKIRLVRETDGNENIIDVLCQGEFFGEMAIIEDALRSASAIAVTDIVLLEFSRDSFEPVILQNFQLSLGLIKAFVNRIWIQRQLLQIYRYQDTIPRLIALLLNLKEAKKTEDKKTKVNISVADLAKWASISIIDCKTGLHGLAKSKLIQIQSDNIILNDIAGLYRQLTLHSHN